MSIRTLALLAAFAIAGLQAGCATQAPAVTHLNSGKVLPTGLPFSEAVRVGDTVYLSGQIGNVPGPGPIKLAPGGMVAEARQTMDNIKTSLEAHGLSMADVVKCTVMLADMKEWAPSTTSTRPISPATTRHAAPSAATGWPSMPASRWSAWRWPAGKLPGAPVGVSRPPPRWLESARS